MFGDLVDFLEGFLELGVLGIPIEETFFVGVTIVPELGFGVLLAGID